ncbi:MAG TPA: serine hydrolase [Puia sp.]|nr:serine hydrolase [Puia sp.]
MKSVIVKLIFLLNVGMIFSGLQAQTPAQEADELLKQYVKQNSFSGVALIAQKGSVLLEKGYGYRDVGMKLLNDTNTVFEIGTLTRQFTATLILMLADAHRLTLGDKLSAYLPGFPNGDSITIENLLTNTSGIHNYSSGEIYLQHLATLPVTVNELINSFKDRPFDFSPGTSYQYSNSGYVLLGYIIEKVTGKTYFDVLRQSIFVPLGMRHSGFDFKNLKYVDKATGYFKLTAKTALKAPVADSTETYAAGAIFSTLGDLYKWDRALYSGKLLQDSSLRRAFTPFLNNYGLGWIIDSSFGKKVVMHEGDIFGFESFIARVPADQTCIILLENKQSSGLSRIAENINSILNGQPYDFPLPHAEIDVDSSTLQTYVGQYRLGPNFILDVTLENGQLMIQATGQAKTELYAEKKNLFFMKFESEEIEFLKNPDDTIDRLVLSQYGQKLTALKIR